MSAPRSANSLRRRRASRTVSRDHDGAMPGADQGVGDFECGALDAPGLQRRQQLHHRQAARGHRIRRYGARHGG
jgi:hypothetical protein